MMFTAKALSTCLGIGYIRKGAGTVAALAGCFGWYFLQGHGLGGWATAAALVLLLLLGVWSAGQVEKVWGHDSNRVVVDEWLGMWLSLFLVPLRWQYILLAFILFRFFDIAKPLYIRKAESLPGGWGVMADDILAGIYSNLLLQLVVKSGWF